ncbi:Tetratricopeptide repeat-containing protein [Prevotella sp. ne3005]|uniref:tetratricopeptide repeat protein n=1 Tax=Prevotella sp. ne3005 TaxID=1761887 RepID=UPI0008CDAF18|nr:tetratricopeptide repeat protein [Prevotella sp. ne3005]SEM73483.1 Tetratricopeptide repeat-containing protein [Prevotella sp. ne3005]
MNKRVIIRSRMMCWTLLRAACLMLFAFHFSSLPAVAQSSREFDQFFLEAMIQRQKGNNAAAFDLLRHCQELNPEAPEVYYFLAQYYSALKNTEKSVDCFKKAAALQPDNVTYMETLAQIYIRQQDFAQAIPVVEKIYERDKERLDLLEILFQLYQQVGRNDKAVEVLNRIEAIDGKSERISMAKSEIFTRQGNKKGAIAEIKALAQKYPNDLNYMALYAETMMMNGQVKKALKVYDQILQQEPDNNRVLMSLRTYHQALGHQTVADSLTERVLLNGNATSEERVHLLRQEIAACEQEGGDSTRVLQLFRKMLARPQSDEDMALLCASYMNAKQMPKDSISRVLEQALAIAPDNSMARLQLVGYAWEKEDMDRVVSLCQDARQYNPDEMAFYYYQGIAFYKQEKLDEALSAFKNGIGVIKDDSNPEIVSDFYAVMGDILHQQGQAEEAFAAYDSCLVWKEDNIGCLNNYAYYLSERGERLSKAEEMSYKTIKAEPKNSTYLDTYAWILYMEKRYAEAKIYIEQAVQNLDEKQDNSVILEHADKIKLKIKEE